MRINCAKTCVYCNDDGSPPTTPEPEECIDTDKDCEVKSGLCRNKNYKSMMLKRCPVTCGFCIVDPTTPKPTTSTESPEITKCFDDPAMAHVCKENAHRCEVEPFKSKHMVKFCKGTCGFPCTPDRNITTTTEAPKQCFDDPTKAQVCKENAHRCEVEPFKTKNMMRFCKGTCGFPCDDDGGSTTTTTTTTTAAPVKKCFDDPAKAHVCKENAHRCNTEPFKKNMITFCKGTCGFPCDDEQPLVTTTTTTTLPPATTTREPCFDLSQDCVNKPQLCTNPPYYDIVKKNCRKTCGFCTQ
ncbi:hypothetical protein PMAYCL1PPCAC_11244 [Pristionchus mayeri]|uniref:ShKT domain-containing protein n=1 Tax=Pristionchus mayeri TaxID=1317129 RepID=A0AAN4ZJK4_9BILA|nr:hypothetical protein PMAYCL1PPCAC_11244 [Pristionchus mayeri]